MEKIQKSLFETNRIEAMQKLSEMQEKMNDGEIIQDFGEYFAISQMPKQTTEDLKQFRIIEIQSRLTALSQDLTQAQAGVVVPDIEKRKAEFRKLHAEIRELEGKEPRGGA